MRGVPEPTVRAQGWLDRHSKGDICEEARREKKSAGTYVPEDDNDLPDPASTFGMKEERNENRAE